MYRAHNPICALAQIDFVTCGKYRDCYNPVLLSDTPDNAQKFFPNLSGQLLHKHFEERFKDSPASRGLAFLLRWNKEAQQGVHRRSIKQLVVPERLEVQTVLDELVLVPVLK